MYKYNINNIWHHLTCKRKILSLSIHVWTYSSKIKLNRLQLGSPTLFLEILADVAVKKVLHNLVPL
jgi:hypothetical protein